MIIIRPIKKISPMQKRYCNVIKSKFVHEWGLENNKSHLNLEEIFIGPFSTSTDNYNLIWECTYKYGFLKYRDEYEDTMILKLLKCETQRDIEIQAICQLKSVLHINEKWVQSELLETKIIGERKITTYKSDSLQLQIQIIILFKDKVISNHKLLEDMSKLIKSGQGDIVFVLDNEEIKAHESILTIRNETFAKMFESDMAEKTSKRVEIKEMDVTVFKELLHYIYTEKEPTIEKEKIKDLFLAAEKYGVDDLKAWCSQEIVKTINDDNITDIYILADLVNSEFLKEKVVQFILENNIKINEINGYKVMLESYFHLVEEMFVKTLERQTQQISKLTLNK